MQIASKEHYELMSNFERDFKGCRFDRETKEFWPKGIVYQDGHTNELFKSYRLGYSLHKAIANMEAA